MLVLLFCNNAVIVLGYSCLSFFDNYREQIMKFSKLTLAIAATLGASVSYNAVALDLYVDTKTKQLFAEPARGRVLLGAYEKVTEPSSAPGVSHSITPASATA